MAAPGDVLADRYELQSRLGRGGMAEVFRAHDRRLDREVAVKVLAPHLLSDARSLERFGREARAAASLNHPNIVNVYDAVNEGETHAIVMELVEGPTLADMIEREGRLSIADATQTAISIADALQAAHDRGLVHHDVKPRNVLFDSDGTLKVADFGIARAASSDITTVQGSPPYLAPEQARGGRSDRRSDVYALGCVMFEMLAGRPPFEGDSASAVVMAHIDTPVPELSRYRPDVPRDLEAAVTRALAKDPDARYDSPAALRADLTRVASGLADASTVAIAGADAGATIVSSNRAMPRDPTVALGDDWSDVPAENTRTYDDEPPPRRPRRGVSARAIAIALAGLLLLVVVAMAWADSGGRQTAEVDPVVSEPVVAPEPDPEPDTSSGTDDGSGNSSLIDQLERRANRLERLLERGRDVDQATQERIDELRRELEQALQQGGDNSGNGSGDSGSESGVLDGQLDALRNQIDQLAEDQQVTQGLVDRLRELVENVNPFGG